MKFQVSVNRDAFCRLTNFSEYSRTQGRRPGTLTRLFGPSSVSLIPDIDLTEECVLATLTATAIVTY
jgi:hypothetical protein